MKKVLVSSFPSEFVMHKLSLVIAATTAPSSYSFGFSPMVFVNAENDLRRLFSGLCVVEMCPSNVVVVSFVPSQCHAEPPVCAALILLAWAAASFAVNGGW